MSLATHCFVLGATLCAGPILALANAPAAGDGIVLVVTPPWVVNEEIVHRSDGKLLGPVSGRFSVFAASDDPAFATKLKTHGAWFVLDGSKMAELCGVKE